MDNITKTAILLVLLKRDINISIDNGDTTRTIKLIKEYTKIRKEFKILCKNFFY